MGIFSNIFKRKNKVKQEPTISLEIADKVCDFLSTHDNTYKLNIFTFTEFFAYIYYYSDFIITSRKLLGRKHNSFCLSTFYKLYIIAQFFILDKKEGNAHLIFFNTRVQEYGALKREKNDDSSIFQKFDYNLSQTSESDHYYNEDEDPLRIKDAFVMLNDSQNITNFYISEIVPLIKRHIESIPPFMD